MLLLRSMYRPCLNGARWFKKYYPTAWSRFISTLPLRNLTTGTCQWIIVVPHDFLSFCEGLGPHQRRSAFEGAFPTGFEADAR
jgi:hypothetical protein